MDDVVSLVADDVVVSDHAPTLPVVADQTMMVVPMPELDVHRHLQALIADSSDEDDLAVPESLPSNLEGVSVSIFNSNSNWEVLVSTPPVFYHREVE